MYITSVHNKHLREHQMEYYNRLSVIKNLNTLAFNKSVTFFAGENGSGKSTLLEAIAVCFGFYPEGERGDRRNYTRVSHSCLSEELVLSKNEFPRHGFFLRAENFYDREKELARDVDDPLLQSFGERPMHHLSHGEDFFSMLQNRFQGNGLYMLDEPEAALSPKNLLSAIILIEKMVRKNSQFIIATHSPVLLGMEGADIYSFDRDTIRLISYEETSSYIITKNFLENRKRMFTDLSRDIKQDGRLV